MSLTKVLLLLPAPADWQGKPAEVFCELSGYPFHRKIEAAGHGYQAWLKRRSGHVDEPVVEEIKSPLNITKEQEDMFSHKKHKKVLEMGVEDPYEIMGLSHLRWRATEDDIRTQFRKLVLLYHPDKLEQATRTEEDDELFKRISKANDTLIDPKKRRILDSQDDFDDTIPTGNEKGDFFEVFAPVFLRFSRWSTVQPCPVLGKLDDPWESTEQFYEFWYSFKSWRDFSFEDEYNVDDAESREEKRWMERQNDRERKRYKKEEASNIFKLTEIAERNDPRVKKRRAEAAEAKKAAKNSQKDSKKAAKAEAEKAANEERERKAQEDKLKAEQEEKNKKDKAERTKAMATAKRKLRSLTNRYSEQNPETGFGPTAEEIEQLCNKCELETILAINTALLANGSDAVDLFNQEMIKLTGKPSTPSSSPVVVKKAAPAPTTKPQDTKTADDTKSRPWNEEELSLLSKGLHRYPGGAVNRWENIAEMMGNTRTVKEIIAKTKEGKTVAKPAELYQADDAFSRFNKNLKKTEVAAEPSVDITLNGNDKANGTTNGVHKENGATKEAAPEGNVWTPEQQKALEAALSANPASKENRWDHIAAAVSGKTKKECIARYKHLVSKIKEKSGK
uniref:Predicted protein n=1 Tax=Hordeum vulgare subsp. vulgare TaxID=112509 RepID=F2DVU6_HORVV|nr:predicted protein [Hordeum vulgare subsp. vulgare]